MIVSLIDSPKQDIKITLYVTQSEDQ